MLAARPLRSAIVTRLVATMGLSDSRPIGTSAVIPSRGLPGQVSLSPYRRVSQVPRRIFPCALSLTTPESPMDATSRFFSTGSRLHHLWQASRLSLHVTRPTRVHLRYGSQVRLTRLR